MDKEKLRKLAESLGFSGKEVIAFIVGAGIMEDSLTKDGRQLFTSERREGFTEFWSDHQDSKSKFTGKLIDIKRLDEK